MNELIEACRDKNFEKIKFLVKHGIDVENNNVALRFAVWQRHLELIKYLVEHGINVNIDHDGPLRDSVYTGNLDVIKYLIENGANIHACDDEALRYAVYYGHLEVVNYLKSIYLKKYKEKFLCHNCLVLPACQKLCSDELVKE